MEATTLTRSDTSVLSALFDPEASLDNTVVFDDTQLDPEEAKRLQPVQELEKKALKMVNEESPETDRVHEAIRLLSQAIDMNPRYASSWNNRAQAQRMLFEDAHAGEHPDLVASIFADLGKAIELASPVTPFSMVSSRNAKVLASAHTHRGYLLLLASTSDSDNNILRGDSTLRDLSKEKLETLASTELQLGGQYGNDTARRLAVKVNPYAKLCGSIVREALTKEMSDYYQGIRGS